jgi:hypothetical protein
MIVMIGQANKKVVVGLAILSCLHVQVEVVEIALMP